MLELYHDWDSVCSFKVRMCLAEKDIHWESRRVDLIRFEHLLPDYLALNPNGVVPTLVHDERAVIESSIINEFVEEAFDGPALMPEAPGARAEMRAWIKYQDDVLYFSQRPASFQLLVKNKLSNLSRDQVDALVQSHPQPQRARHFIDWATGPVDQAVVDDARTKLAGVLARLDGPLSARNWLAGDAFSLAEVAYAPFIERMERLRFHGLWADKPAVQAWMERIKARPAYVRSVSPAEFLMPGPGA